MRATFLGSHRATNDLLHACGLYQILRRVRGDTASGADASESTVSTTITGGTGALRSAIGDTDKETVFATIPPVPHN